RNAARVKEEEEAAERARRNAAEALRKQQRYDQTLEDAHKALTALDYDLARVKFEEAGKLFKTDAVAAGIKRVETAKVKALEDKEAAEKIAKEAVAKEALAKEAARAAKIKTLVEQGNAHLEARNYKKAMEVFTWVKELAPDDKAALLGLSQAKEAQER